VGAAAIAVVRLCGARTGEFLRGHFSRPAVNGRAVHGVLSDGEEVIDDPLVVLHADGQTADLSVHGGPWVVRRVLELAERNGFDVLQASSGPLNDAAVDGADEIERRVMTHVPLATTELGLRHLLAQPAAWRRRERMKKLPEVAQPCDRSLWWLLHPPRVAIVGAANVGKSTLANQLFAQERSITADMPGTTRDWVGEMADIEGLPIFLMDTPGLRQTHDEIERAAIAGGCEKIAEADLVVLVVTARQSIAERRDWVGQYPRALAVRNMCDRATDASVIDASRPHVFTVATSGEGVDDLRQAIRRQFIRPWRHVGRAMRFDRSD
jgi:tRNA U34 5-carboxymethylaminomethyl modifying GTPase MnmE/TrmE